MAYTTINELMTAIANAIRSKKGTTAKIASQDMPTEIESITTGGNYQSKTITQNGTYYPDEGYDAFSDVTVNCEGEKNWEIKNCAYLFHYGYRLYNDRCEDLIRHIKKPNNCMYMFAHCTNHDINNYFDLSKLDTSEVTSMEYMFANLGFETTTLDLNSWDTRNLTSVFRMFSSSKLTTLNINNWNTSKLKNMSSLVDQCDKITSLDLSNWNLQNVESLDSTFSECKNLYDLKIDFSTLTTKLKSLRWTFYRCYKLLSIDVSKIDTRNVTDMNYLFKECYSLTELDISNFNTSKVTSYSNFGDMLALTSYSNVSQCTSIKGFSATGIKSGTLSLFGTAHMPNLKHFIFGGAFYSTACTAAVTINMARLDGLEEGDETTGVVEMFNSLPENTTSYTHVIKLHTNVYNLLSDATKSIATNKGYSLTYGNS